MKNIFAPFIIGLSIIGSVLAIPSPDPNPWGNRHYDRCLDEREANDILNRWISLFVNMDSTVASQTVTENFQLFSDSIDYLAGRQPGSITGIPVYANISAFIAGQEADQASGTKGGFAVRSWFYGCTGISFVWRYDGTTATGNHVGFAGIDHLLLDRHSHLIYRAYTEENNGELLYDLGYVVCPLNATNSTSR
ncbi:hypothetical protein L228DRAFT_241873 [Xylona heveae TC161]|uniref:NTF2-like domain-containing protein n=1 Tax=Xylona heveae (strain CBS 132557 / TC161) TaxID=1328760 RepID=A0A164ZKC8_XYLHT|nr:hypothetical protein L228DRAFT_241873 [Xylona heveae TC161]KZF19201.1 hypothetical protein L228DRAFT_241873 [Xylona heveae TC161]